jgi:hypothetical protein
MRVRGVMARRFQNAVVVALLVVGGPIRETKRAATMSRKWRRIAAMGNPGPGGRFGLSQAEGAARSGERSTARVTSGAELTLTRSAAFPTPRFT